jgi:adenylosuccinate synthase
MVSPLQSHWIAEKRSLTLVTFVVKTNITGLDCSGRLFISDRAHLVFDFHQIVDGLKEVELGGSSCVSFRYSFCRNLAQLMGDVYSIGTTKKGIGPAYSAKASRSGLRVHHLFDPTFAEKFRKIVEGRYKRYGHFEYDTEGEIERYKVRFSSASPHPRAWSFPMSDVTHFLTHGFTGIGGKAAPFRH